MAIKVLLYKHANQPEVARRLIEEAQFRAFPADWEQFIILFSAPRVCCGHTDRRPPVKRSRLRALAALAALVWVVSHYVPVGADEPQPRIPVPGEQAIAEALKLVRNVYQADYAKKKSAEQVEFAKKLLLAAVETKDDPTARYVMYCEARDLAIKAGDVNLAPRRRRRNRPILRRGPDRDEICRP